MAGVDLYLRAQTLDTSTPSGRALFQMLGVFAEFERAMIRERVQAGIDRARSAGKQLGRPRIHAGRADATRASLAAGSVFAKRPRSLGSGLAPSAD